MDWKNFLKPNIWKLVVFIILLLLTIFIPKTTQVCSMGTEGVVCGDTPAKGIGYPIFYGDRFYGDAGVIGFYPLNFLINILVFYTLSCFMLWIIGIIKKPKDNN